MTLKEKWEVYTEWLQTNLPQYATLLNKGANEEEIDALKNYFPFSLPEELFELYRLNNGDAIAKNEPGLGSFMGLEFLPIDRIIKEHESWSKIPEDDNTELSTYCSAKPEGVVKLKYANLKWIPILADYGGNYIGIDLDPDIKGVIGQIINFGRDEMDKVQIARNLDGLLDVVLEEISNGNCNKAIVLEDDGGYSYGLRPQSHLIDDLKVIIGIGLTQNRY